MVSAERDIATHYAQGDLLARLQAALREDGVEPERPSIDSLAPYDHFHGRGLEATEEIAARMEARPADHLLDIGSGLGGPARYFARRFGCRVSGIDLTAEFCELARHLTRLVGLEERVRFELGNALAMPFADASFDGAYSMNVSMNIADKGALYRSGCTASWRRRARSARARARWSSAARSRRTARSCWCTARSHPSARRTPRAG